MQLIPLVGRVMFSLIFISAGIMGHFMNNAQTSAYAASMGLPFAVAGVYITGVMIVLGGLSILLGYRVKIGAILVLVFLLLSNFTIHTFWAIPDPMMSQMQMVMFMKNLSMAGAALMIYYFGSGPYSLGSR